MKEFNPQHDTGRRPFTTPDGYFDSFTDRLMERMGRDGLLEPTAEAPATATTNVKAVRLNPLRRLVRYAAAAVLAGICIGTATYLYQRQDSAETLTANNNSELLYSDEVLEYELDCEMVNNHQIAYYLTEAY